MRTIQGLMACLVALLGVVSSARAARLPGLGEVAGSVEGAKDRIVKVYLYNSERRVGYAVFAVQGKYRAIDLFPGHYEITLRTGGFEMAPVPIDVQADRRVMADLSPTRVAAAPTYVGGMTFADAKVEPYEEVYPPGEGREIIERTCIVCHGVNWLPTKQFERAAWDAYVHYMTSEPGFRRYGLIGGASLVDPARISDRERVVLLDYLTAQFGPGAEKRVVQQDEEPHLDPAALAKAMYIEYRFPNTQDWKRRFTQEVHFDPNGNVFTTNPNQPASIIRVDPRTGDSKTYFTVDPKSYPHGLTVDADGTVWWAGSDNFLGHLDPATGLTDQYPATEQGLNGHTPAFTSKGDLWFSMLTGNKIGHWDRATDTVTYYETPSERGRPYGLIVDHADKVWYVEYFTDAVVRFDPDTKTFRRYKIQSSPAQMRRLGVDSKNIIWFGVYGRVGGHGRLGRLDPKTGEVTEYDLPIEYANPYDAWADEQDHIWVSSDNYLSRFDPVTKQFTVYPEPERTDAPKITTTRDGAVWYAPRGAGWGGYGGAASVLYPDMDAIKTLGAYYSDQSAANLVAHYHGPKAPVTGAVKLSKDGAQNPEMPGEKTVGRPMESLSAARVATEDRTAD